jgi:hypothetical protein
MVRERGCVDGKGGMFMAVGEQERKTVAVGGKERKTLAAWMSAKACAGLSGVWMAGG